MKDFCELILDFFCEPERVLLFILFTLPIIGGCIYANMTKVFVTILLVALIFVVLPICISSLAKAILKKWNKNK